MKPAPAIPSRVPALRRGILVVFTALTLNGANGIAAEKPIDIGIGPQLFFDDYIVGGMTGLRREVRGPSRHPEPVLDRETFGTTQHHITVLRDTRKPGFRAWYNRGDSVWHAESPDGIRWANPQLVWELSYAFGSGVIDDREREKDPQKRFKMANWQQNERGKPGPDSGMWVGFSPDGLQWTSYEKNPVLLNWPEGVNVLVPHRTSDIIEVFYDPLQRHYAAYLKMPAVAEDGFAPAPRSGRLFRRLVGISTSKDFMEWETPQRILLPDDKDDGLLEFYGMSGVHQRGSLYIGLVRVLRDDLAATPGGPKDGIGYTELATSRDGVKWTRHRDAFLSRNPQPGSWDHAMAWGGCVLPVGDELHIYYAGFAQGHKLREDRQLGLARMKRDRYMAVVPRGETGTLRTRTLIVPKHADRLTINADAAHGEVRVRLLDIDGKPLHLLGNPEAQPIRGDVIGEQVRWEKSLHALEGRPVQLEFTLQNAALFGFEIHFDEVN